MRSAEIMVKGTLVRTLQSLFIVTMCLLVAYLGSNYAHRWSDDI